MREITPAVAPIEIDPSPVPHLGQSRLSWRVRLRKSRHAPQSQVKERPSASEGRRILVERARALTLSEISNPDVSQRDIADKLAVSQRHLQRSYSEAESSWSKELASMRMNHAKQLFEDDPSLHVSAVARAVGYRRPHQFAKAFHRLTGYWPKDYRSRCRLAEAI